MGDQAAARGIQWRSGRAPPAHRALPPVFIQSSVNIIPVCPDEETGSGTSPLVPLSAEVGNSFFWQVNVFSFGSHTCGSKLLNSAIAVGKAALFGPKPDVHSCVLIQLR